MFSLCFETMKPVFESIGSRCVTRWWVKVGGLRRFLLFFMSVGWTVLVFSDVWNALMSMFLCF